MISPSKQNFKPRSSRAGFPTTTTVLASTGFAFNPVLLLAESSVAASADEQGKHPLQAGIGDANDEARESKERSAKLRTTLAAGFTFCGGLADTVATGLATRAGAVAEPVSGAIPEQHITAGHRNSFTVAALTCAPRLGLSKGAVTSYPADLLTVPRLFFN
jgi:hypothetical protein